MYFVKCSLLRSTLECTKPNFVHIEGNKEAKKGNLSNYFSLDGTEEAKGGTLSKSVH